MGVLTAGWFTAYLDRFIISILIEPMRADLGLSDTQLSLVQGFAFALFFVFAGLPIGRLTDRANRRNILIFGITCWSLATVACGLAQDFWHLFFARMAVGIGEACLAPASFSLVADMIAPKRRGLAMGALVGGTSIGNAGSIILGGFLLQHFSAKGQVVLPFMGEVEGWQLVFFIVGAPGLLVGGLMMLIREPARRERAKTASAAEFFPFLRRNRLAIGLTIATFGCSMIANNGVAAWAPAILMRIYGMPPETVGLSLGAFLLTCGTFGPPIAGAVSDWLDRRVPRLGRLGVPLLVYPLMLAVHIVWWFVDDPIYAVVAYGLSAPLLGNLINGSTYPALNQMAPNELRGQLVTFYLLVATLAGIGLAPTGVALITEHVFHDPMKLREAVILVAAPSALLGIVCSLLALKPYKRTCEETARIITEG